MPANCFSFWGPLAGALTLDTHYPLEIFVPQTYGVFTEFLPTLRKFGTFL